MSNIEFEADNMDFNRQGSQKGSNKGSGGSQVGMANWLIKHGIISSDSGAKVILVGFIVFNFAASFVILKYFGVI